MSNEDLTALFCNLLDNAIEAAYRIPEGCIEVTDRICGSDRLPCSYIR
ncbi:MAG: GHKL domain-containing protein [Lachnospiraceae bacterium]|nr:GHKL domain-containing protein [Lachnospiraceae bacterium]